MLCDKLLGIRVYYRAKFRNIMISMQSKSEIVEWGNKAGNLFYSDMFSSTCFNKADLKTAMFLTCLEIC